MAGDKTEKATPKKRQDERKKGNIFQSKDVVAVISLFAGFYSVKFFFPMIYEEIKVYLLQYMQMSATITEVSSNTLIEMAMDFVMVCCKICLPIALLIIVVSVVGSGAQTRFLFTGKNLAPKFSRLNPINGIKNLFSLKNVVEVLKGSIKITILFVIVYQFIKGSIYDFARTLSMDLKESSVYMLQAVIQMLNKVLMAFVLIAGFDYLYQKWEYERQLKMSKQEIKEEYKQMEGDPLVKGKIKDIQRQRARARMMQAVPEADVVIRNPTHFAVALKYDIDNDAAPVVVAKGQDELALRIVKIAEENKVFVMEDRPLARALYASTEVNQQIPAEYYGTVAEILVYIYQLNKKDY